MNKLNVLVSVILLNLVSQALWAAPGAAKLPDGYIPWSELVIPQIVNVTIFVSILAFLLRAPVSQYFRQRKLAFEAAKVDAEKAKQAAEATHQEVKRRLQDLESSMKSDIETAKKEAQNLREKIVQEATAVATRLGQEADRSAELELHKAMFSLRTELLNKSIEIAESELKSGATSEAQSGLQKAFVQRAQGVQL